MAAGMSERDRLVPFDADRRFPRYRLHHRSGARDQAAGLSNPDLSTGAKLELQRRVHAEPEPRPEPGVFVDVERPAQGGEHLGPGLRWVGTDAHHPTIPLTAGLNGIYARVHAPNPLVEGSSVSHFSEALSPDEVMEPVYNGPNHNVDLTLRLFSDIGWTPKCTPEVTTMADSDTLTVSQTLTSWELEVEVENTGGFTAYNVIATMSGGPVWLAIPDATCDYLDLAAAAGLRTDHLRWTSRTGGGPFTVDLLVEWDDVCGNRYTQM
jgi:hypothetical protein